MEDINASVAQIAETLRQEGVHEQKCLLCELKKKTKWYFDSKRFVVLEDEKLKCPMIVFKKHIVKAKPRIQKKMVWRLTEVCDKIYGKDKWKLNTKMSSIKDHIHFRGLPTL